jgi:RimJ/RimL family protein N-acetyltransferase
VIRLEQLDRSHLDGLAAVAADPDVRRFTRVPDPVPPGFPESWLGRYEDGRREGTRDGFAIVGHGGDFLGVAVVPKLDREARTAELGYVVVREARGRGVATEALRLLTEWAFAAGMVRIELLISVDNPASKRVAERCGYVREGVLRSLHVKQDVREDTEIWSGLVDDR